MLRKVHLLEAICCLAVFALTSGCGTSAYDDLLKKRTTEVRNSAKFNVLFGPTELPDTSVKIRVPQIFKNSYQDNSAHPEDGPKISPERAQPPFLALPGFKLCYEGCAFLGRDKLPYYCYLGALPSKPGDAAKLEGELARELKTKLPQTGAWVTVDCPTPDGRTASWRKIRATGEQPFRFLSNNELVVKNMPGTFELWLHDGANYVVLVGWRVAQGMDIAGEEAPAEGKGAPPKASGELPNLATMPVLTAGSVQVGS